MSEGIKVEKTDSYLSTSDVIAPFGDQVFDMPRGPVFGVEVPGSTVIQVDRNGEASIVVVMLYHPPMDGQPLGAAFFTQFSADSARQFGASLIKVANQIDGGAVQ